MCSNLIVGSCYWLSVPHIYRLDLWGILGEMVLWRSDLLKGLKEVKGFLLMTKIILTSSLQGHLLSWVHLE